MRPLIRASKTSGFFSPPRPSGRAIFYRPERGGGLWEASTHDKGGKRWIKPPVPKGQPGFRLRQCDGRFYCGAVHVDRTGTAGEWACLYGNEAPAQQAQERPVTRVEHQELLQRGLRSSVVLDRIHSKLGIGDFLNDVALIERTVHPDPADRSKDRKIRYVAAGFDDPSPAKADGPARFLNKLIVELDKCILENNGLLAPSAP